MLAVIRLEPNKRGLCTQATVAQEVERLAVIRIRTGLGDNVDHRGSCASGFCAISVGGDAKLLHNVIAELIGSAVSTACLREETVVIVGPVDEKA